MPADRKKPVTNIRTYVATAVTAGLLMVTFAGTAAHAAEPIDILFYSNDTYTDVLEEDATMIAAATAGGGTVTSFDGGDGSVAAWTTALDGIEIVILPEGYIYDPSGSAALSTEVVDLIGTWVGAGGQVFLGAFLNHDALVSQLTGLDYSAAWDYSGAAEPFTLQIDAPLPSELLYANGTDALETSGFTPELLAPFTPVYSNGTGVVVATLSLGTGHIVGFGYDWFPDEDDVTSGARAPWDAVLAYFIGQAAPAAEPEGPKLAETGVAQSPVLWIGGGILLILGASLVILRTVSRRA